MKKTPKFSTMKLRKMKKLETPKPEIVNEETKVKIRGFTAKLTAHTHFF